MSRHKSEFKKLVDDHIDILFANEDEIVCLYEAKNFDEAKFAVQKACHLAVLTRGSKGSVIVSENEIIEINAQNINSVVDTTGAGDAYAAGFLHGIANNFDLKISGKLGAKFAAEVISYYGARPNLAIAEKVKSILM